MRCLDIREPVIGEHQDAVSRYSRARVTGEDHQYAGSQHPRTSNKSSILQPWLITTTLKCLLEDNYFLSSLPLFIISGIVNLPFLNSIFTVSTNQFNSAIHSISKMGSEFPHFLFLRSYHVQQHKALCNTYNPSNLEQVNRVDVSWTPDTRVIHERNGSLEIILNCP